MEKKYELVKDDFVMVNGNKLYRIKSLIDIEPWVAAGQLGGYIEKEENLSHEGNCWVFDHAMVYDKAVIKEDAQVSLNAQVYGQAIMSGQSMATDHATVHDNAMLKGNIRVSGYASIFKDAKVYGRANIDFKVTGEDEVIIYTDPTDPRYIITTSSKQDWFNSFRFSGPSKDFMEEANKLDEEKASRYKAIVDLHLSLYKVR